MNELLPLLPVGFPSVVIHNLLCYSDSSRAWKKLWKFWCEWINRDSL